MANTHESNIHGTGIYEPEQIVDSFKQSVVNRFVINIGGRTLNYQEYLSLPKGDRSDDEADAVDRQFATYALRWLGFENENDWNYNRPQAGRKANRPDFSVNALIGKAFIWEDKNSTIDLEDDHLKQMRRYSIDTAGYAVWCNMRRICAIRFQSSDRLDYDILADIAIEGLFSAQTLSEEQKKTSITNLALFRLLFGKERFTRFTELADKIAVSEDFFKQDALPLTTIEAKESFISGSRQSLDHLRLAALTQIRKSLESHSTINEEESALHREWESAIEELKSKLTYERISKAVLETIEKNLTPRLGDLNGEEISQIRKEIEKAVGASRLTVSLNTAYEKWRERAVRINNAFLVLRFRLFEPTHIASAYKIWSERQSDKNDAKPEIFAEQVAYVFFIRLLLVRILEDKNIIRPRLASNGGFSDWRTYVKNHFQELNGIGILNQNYCTILTQKTEHYYLHFFQQPVFDWFTPDDFLLVETLEFLCRYNFQRVASDIIGFTYEEYIQKNARKRKGHFLTRDEVVEYMLDLLGYDGAQILSRRVFDPACGSGSFLVHSASRYRRALVAFFCRQHGVKDEEALSANPIYRKELAQRYLDDLTNFFFGMELNPFACYLAEMNMLIQGLDDLFVLQQAGDMHPIERFQIFNTDSLELPHEVLENADITNTENTLWTPSLSDSLADESFPVKARAGEHSQGFFFILSNPPYINTSQISLANDYNSYPFYNQVLSRAVNTYLLFLRLGMYYLGTGGRMVYIVPLTIIGDASAAALRKNLQLPPFKTTTIVRFFTGNVLFPGVDQAVAIVRVEKEVSVEPDIHERTWQVNISGGYTVPEARQSQTQQQSPQVFESTPTTADWQSAWLVSNDANSYRIWEHVKNRAESTLGRLWENHFEVRQGDVRSDHVQSFCLGRNHQSAPGDIAIQKGEDVFRYAPLTKEPYDWARPKTGNISDSRKKAVNDTLLRIQQLATIEQGITVRKIARLNTRETLIATWFQRDKNNLLIFPDEHWRFRLLPAGNLTVAKAILALFNSRPIAYLLNLFSTNNNVAQGELARLLIPDQASFPAQQLAEMADNLLNERAFIENEYALKYGAILPEFDDGTIYIPPSRMLLATSQVPKLSLEGWVMQGAISNRGANTNRIKSLRTRNMVEYTGEDAASARVLQLFLDESSSENETWLQAQNWQLPDTVIAASWLRIYDTVYQQAQSHWNKFVLLQQQVDEVVADWYGFDSDMRNAITRGLPWARKRRIEEINNLESETLLTDNNDTTSTSRIPVTSSVIYALAYDEITQTLEVELHSGEVFAYENVPEKTYLELMSAASKGNYYTKKIKGKYNTYKR